MSTNLVPPCTMGAVDAARSTALLWHLSGHILRSSGRPRTRSEGVVKKRRRDPVGYTCSREGLADSTGRRFQANLLCVCCGRMAWSTSRGAQRSGSPRAGSESARRRRPWLAAFAHGACRRHCCALGHAVYRARNAARHGRGPSVGAVVGGNRCTARLASRPSAALRCGFLVCCLFGGPQRCGVRLGETSVGPFPRCWRGSLCHPRCWPPAPGRVRHPSLLSPAPDSK